MSKVLESSKEKYGVTEAYEVVQTVDVHWEGKRPANRIEVLKCYVPSPGRYTVRYWDFEHVRLQPSYPRTNGPKGPEFERDPEDMLILVRNPWRPSVYEETAERALAHALSFLSGKG